MSGQVRAADTTEPFDVGATNFEIHLGVDGLGRGKYEKGVFGEVVLGYGIAERFSGWFATMLQSNEYFAEGAVGFSFGVYGTVVDTPHFDLDLFLDVSGGPGDFVVTPMFELNVDAKPDMSGFGAYLRSGVGMSGRDEAAEGAPEPDYGFAAQIETTLGTYLTLRETHQLLLEFDAIFRLHALEDEHNVEVGGLALGYNVSITDNIELINQVYFDIPQGDEKFAVGVSTGFIATLP